MAPGVAFQIVRTWQAKKCTTLDYTCTSILYAFVPKKKLELAVFHNSVHTTGQEQKIPVVKMDISLTLQEVWRSVTTRAGKGPTV